MGLAATPAMAAAPGAAVFDCTEGTGSIVSIVEPWANNTRTFYGGQVRVVYVDTGGEPVCCSGHLALLYPDEEPGAGGAACKTISKGEGMGFLGLDFAGMKAGYDPKRGLLLTLRVQTMNENGEGGTWSTVRVRVRQKPWSVTVEP